jgi:glycosyltransferase involved in cell wall biosynthesis
MSPTVSVLMPVYNGEAFLREAIDSILNQTFTDFEFIIINDGSTDRSEEIIKSYTDQRIKYYKNEQNLRLISTLNKGIKLTVGKYIVRMDADDISMPERLEKQVKFMEQNPHVVVCGSWAETFGKEKAPIHYLAEHNDIMFKMLYQCHLVHPTIIMRGKEIRAFTTHFDPAFLHAEDYDFFVRLGYVYKLANIREVLLKYRSHAGSVSKAHNEIQKHNSQTIRLNQFLHLGYPVTVPLLVDFESLNHHAYKRVKSGINEIRNMLDGMLTANEKTNIFDQHFLEKKLSNLWFHYCYHVSTPNVFYAAKRLSANSKPNLTQQLKWQLNRLKN